MKLCRQVRLIVLLLPGRRVYQGGGRKYLPRPKPVWPETGQYDLVRGPQVLGNFSRVLELKMSVWGLGFYLACKTRFI